MSGVATIDRKKAPHSVQAVDIRPVLVPQNFDQLVRFAELAAVSDLMPRDYRGKPANIMIAVQMGSELGLSPMQSVNSIAVINGRPGVWGDGLIGICMQSPLCEDIIETIEGDGDARSAKCVAKRLGKTPVSRTFSVADAKKAGLWGKAIWGQYPDRMLQNRARGFALRDAFPDLLRGLKTVEELRDTPRDDYTNGVTIEAKAATRQDSSGSPAAPRRTWRTLVDEIQDMLLSADQTEDGVAAIAELPAVRKALTDGPMAVQDELSAMLADAYARVRVSAEDEPSGDVLDLEADPPFIDEPPDEGPAQQKRAAKQQPSAGNAFANRGTTKVEKTTPPDDGPTDVWLEGALRALNEEPDGKKWMALLRKIVPACTTINQIVAIERAPSVIKVLEVPADGAAATPPRIRDEIEALFQTASAKLVPPPQDDTPAGVEGAHA